jgi:hypothetical protein
MSQTDYTVEGARDWWCPECREFRAYDGEEGYACDAPLDCPSEAFGDDNCGYIVCSECHSPLSDRHLSGP